EHDPTAALAWLKTYPPDASDWQWASAIAADAVSRGVARHVLGEHDDRVTSVAFSPDGQVLATGSYGGVRLWEVATGRQIATLPSHPVVNALAFAPSGRTLAVASGQAGGLDLWDLETRTRRALEGHVVDIQRLAFAPDGTKIASGDYSGQIRLWDVR